MISTWSTSKPAHASYAPSKDHRKDQTMAERSLWRLDGATAATLAEPVRLVQGLRLHLEHTELTTVLMQLGDQQQAYIAAAGCEGCIHGRCTPGCYVELLR